MSRLTGCLQTLRSSGRKALATFITAGDPDSAATVPALHALVAGGADILELGIPFSDPEAEGPTIQASSERGLASGMTLRGCLKLVAGFREKDAETPVILMGYLNSVMAMGFAAFAGAAAQAGVDGLILVNLPPEEAEELKGELAPHGIDLIFLVAPTTTTERARMIASHASGFIYYVSLKGTTGAGHLIAESVAAKVSELRAASPLPVLVGFGIKDGETASAVARHADGVVVGSALVNTMACQQNSTLRLQELTAQVASIRTALDAGSPG
ncbi:MAG: tryptophan synthase subunit alpha [Pseudomonadales bacterium]|nr:tryptophan synthase subunit alpha [Pseudomonadales bacterium]